MHVQEALRIVDYMNRLANSYRKGKMHREHYESNIQVLHHKLTHNGYYRVYSFMGEYILEHEGVR